MSEPAGASAAPSPAASDSGSVELQRWFGIAPSTADLLLQAGFGSIDSVRALSDAKLQELGVDADEVQRIHTASEARSAEPPDLGASPTPPKRAAADGEKIIERWMDNVRKTERPKRRHVAVQGKDSADVLRKWVQGDDKALESWIQSSEMLRPVPSPRLTIPPAPPPPTIEPATESVPPTLEAPPPAGPITSASPPLLPDQIREREETVVRWLTDLLDRVKTDQFDPQSLLQEVQEIHRQLFEERAHRKQLDEELEHVKRGSIAVIKYVRSREAKQREQAIQAKDAEIAELRLKLLGTGGAGPGESGTVAPTEPDGPEGPTGEPAGPAEPLSKDAERRIRGDFENRERQYIERETELRRRVVQLEGEIRNLRTEATSLQERLGASDRTAPVLPEDVAGQLKEVESRERDLALRENELRTKFEEIRINAEELERRRQPLELREKEISLLEEQVTTRAQALELEARRIEQAKQDGTAQEEIRISQVERKKLDELQNQLLHKEAELKARESFIQQRTEELETLQKKIASGAEDVEVAVAPEKKVKSGVRRLDDLLFGGYPLGSQVLLNGPAHTGKDILARLFVAEGLKIGFPAIWVVTDKTYLQVREEMTALYPGYVDAEAKGLIRYVDLYARSLGVTQAEPGVRLLSSTDKSVMDQLTQTVNNYSQELKEKAPAYRLVFESVSTVTAYLDTTAMFRFLQPFAGRRKMDGAASYYLLETGMHTESDLQALEHMMDGSVNLKVEQLKTFLQVRGISEVQSRAWIGFTFSKKAFNLGSFSLDHIR